MNIGEKEARHLLDVLIYVRKAIIIAQTITGSGTEYEEMRQLALERCIEIIDEAFQHAGRDAAGQIDESLQLNLSQLRYLVSRDYHQVNPEVLRRAAVQMLPELVRRIEPLEDELYRIGRLEKPPISGPQ